MTLVITREKLADFVAWARARDNLYYGYGEYFEVDPRFSTDCSGLTMSTAAFLIGKKWDRRYGSTEDFRLHRQVCYDLGLLPGAGGPEHFAKFGLYHGGGGPNSHTACTINGVAWESSGAHGVQYGPPARHWNDPLFTGEPWHLDAVLEPEARPFLDKLTDAQKATVVGAAIQTGQPHTNALF